MLRLALVAALLLPAGSEAQDAMPRTGIDLTFGLSRGAGGDDYTDRMGGAVGVAIVRRIDPLWEFSRVGVAADLNGLRPPSRVVQVYPFPQTASLSLVAGGAWPVGYSQELRVLVGPTVTRVLGSEAEFIARDRGGIHIRVDFVGRDATLRRFALVVRHSALSSAGGDQLVITAFGLGIHF